MTYVASKKKLPLSTFTIVSVAAATLVSVGMLSTSACTAGSVTSSDVESDLVQGADELNGSPNNPPLDVGTKLRTTDGVNFRTKPSISSSILRVVPSGSIVAVAQTNPENGFYRVKHNGTTGWITGKYLEEIASEGGAQASGARAQAIARAKSSVGFSYWWGHGRWLPEGPSASTKGKCYGSCPSCSHSGQYGADCSGMVAKAWKVSGSGTSLTDDAHPYSTADFYYPTVQWKQISRDNLETADALVYRSGGAGHIMLYSSGDGWGSFYAYECKACAAGCVYNLRSVSSSYKSIRRTTF